MARDYSNVLAAVFDETLETLRERVKTATDNAADHRASARHHQQLVDREANFAARDEERARQWQVLLEVAEEMAAPDAEASDDAVSASERFEHDQADEARLDAVAAVWSDAMFDDSEGGE